MHDIHIHTSLSKCARVNSEPEDFFREIPLRGLAVAGFSNHLWDSAVPGASAWYRSQNIEHLLPLKKQLSETFLPGVKLRFGCEVEYIGNGVISLHPDHAELFDYVLVAPNHFHMVGLVRPASICGGEALSSLMFSRFMEVCEFDFVTGIAHPFYPFGFPGREAEILNQLPEKRLEECFRLAAERGKSIEVNLSVLCKLQAADALEPYRRVMQIAPQCGCRFHIGSDAHGLCQFGEDRRQFGMAFAEKCAIRFPEDPLEESKK